MKALEKYAMAAFGVYHNVMNADLVIRHWDQASPSERERWRQVADAVLMAADMLNVEPPPTH